MSKRSAEPSEHERLPKRPSLSGQVACSRTYKDRDGEMQLTFAWNSRDALIAICTTTKNDSSKSVFLASHTIIERDCPNILPDTLPTNPEDMFDQYPLVQVEDDAVDVQEFLEAIHDFRSYFRLVPTEGLHSDCVLSLYRMAHRYQVAFLLEKLDEIVNNDFMYTNLADFDKLDWNSEDMNDRQNTANLLNALEEAHRHYLLPAAVYQSAATWTLSEVLQAPKSRSSPGNGELWFSAEEARMRVIKAHAAMGRYFAQMVAALLGNPLACPNTRSCCDSVHTWATQFTTVKPDLAADVLYIDEITGLCKPCKDHSVTVRKELREKFWEEIPRCIGLADWKVLRENFGVADSADGEDEEEEEDEDEDEDEIEEGDSSGVEEAVREMEKSL